MRVGILGLIVMAGCEPADTSEGTAVGNPGSGFTMRLRVDESLAFVSGQLPLEEVTLQPCDGDEPVLVASRVVVDATGHTRLTLPSGSWCELRVQFDGVGVIQGEGARGGFFTLALALEEVIVQAPLGFDTVGRELLLDLGPPGLLSVDTLGLDVDAEVVIEPDDPRHDELVGQIRRYSVLFEDRDDDGTPAEEEAVAASEPGVWGLEPEPDTGEPDIVPAPSCAQAPAAPWWLALLALMGSRRALRLRAPGSPRSPGPR